MQIEEIGTLEAKTRLSELLNQVLEGRSFYLTRRGKRIAELRPVTPPSRARRAGFAKGTFTYIAPDFDAPLDDFADTSTSAKTLHANYEAPSRIPKEGP